MQLAELGVQPAYKNSIWWPGRTWIVLLLIAVSSFDAAVADVRLADAVQNRDMTAVGTLLAEQADGMTALFWAAHKVFTFDACRVKNGNIVEHWDGAVINPPFPAAGRGQ